MSLLEHMKDSFIHSMYCVYCAQLPDSGDDCDLSILKFVKIIKWIPGCNVPAKQKNLGWLI